MNDEISQAEAIAIFHKFDDTSNAAQIPSNDQDEQFYKFYEKLKELTGKDYDFETGDDIQDANFHSEIYIDDKRHALVFSSYGNLVLIGNSEGVDPTILRRVISLAKVSGYIYIPDKLTGLPYDGVHSGAETWWDRYFSW